MKVQQTKKFNRQLKKLAKKRYPIQTLKVCVKAIIENDEETLIRIKNHHLSGAWKGYREFHPARIGNYSSRYDKWIVIYKIDKGKLILTLVSTGGHDIL